MVLTSLTFLLLAISIVAVANTPVKGYELSVYESTPLIFWIAIILGTINGGALLLRYLGSRSKIWIAGLAEIILCNMLIVSLYLLRGSFYIDRGDGLSYIGYSIDLINAGFLPGMNFYPIMTILISSTTEITGIPVFWVAQLFPSFFLIIYTLSIFCWAKAIFNRSLFIASMMFASLPIFFAWFMPALYYQSFCVMALPLFFYTLRRGVSEESGDVRFRLLTFLLLIFFALAHQLVAMGLMLFMVIIFINETRTSQSSKSVSIPLISFLLVILFVWIFTQASLVQSITVAYQQIVGASSEVTAIGEAQGLASKLGLLSTMMSLLLCTIDDLIFLLLSIFVGAVIWRRSSQPSTLAAYFVCLLGGFAMMLALMLSTHIHNPIRLVNLNFGMVFAIPLVGYLLYTLRVNRARIRAGLVIGLVLLCVVTCTSSIYLDPSTQNPNGTTTISEISGYNWYLSSDMEQKGTFSILTGPTRFADLLYGNDYTVKYFGPSSKVLSPGDHFVNITDKDSSPYGDYVTVSKYDRVAYTQVWKTIDRYNNEDFWMLDSSTAVSKIYSSPGLACYVCQ